MTTREENKQKLIQKVIARPPLCKVLRTISWFGWATENQIARYQGISTQRINMISRELCKNIMVKYKEMPMTHQKYWYLIKKGEEVLWEKIENDLKQKVISQEEYNSLAPAPLFQSKYVPNEPDTHAYYVRETIVALEQQNIICLSPRPVLWIKYPIGPEMGKKLKRYESLYKIRVDTYATKAEWDYPFVGVEAEKSFKGNSLFPRKLAKQQKMFRETNIPFLYVPTNKEVEHILWSNIPNRLRKDGEYVVKIKGHSQRYGKYDYKIGIRNALGFLFSNVKMTKFYAPIAISAEPGQWKEYSFSDLGHVIREMASAKLLTEEFAGPLGVSENDRKRY